MVDDDQDEHIFFTDALSGVSPKIECLHARDGEAAIDLLSYGPKPDYIFLDVRMPRMNGKECLSAIKSMTAVKDIPVIIYSAGIQEKEIKSFVELGAEVVVMKPTIYEELVRILKGIIVSDLSWQ
jgi:CheY-like chemotaxis protein